MIIVKKIENKEFATKISGRKDEVLEEFITAGVTIFTMLKETYSPEEALVRLVEAIAAAIRVDEIETEQGGKDENPKVC